ncbi:DUF1285 domain-containing protein [Azospirillum griseum]|uniref:DUF1285 domain-containing protein n=1 Tax=Azospirillum griseum TaxID=2496639 RepID=A0A3S0HZH4_9PROT|nr:DUF1285 domain-containing protein [Azospirillum griseum]RTR22896.1 DUF1285 domain-containing protein [Azospirillum griseum]
MTSGDDTANEARAARRAALTPPVGAPPLPDRLPGEEAYDIRIARDGTWFHNGEPIHRIELAKLFATILQRDAVGDYWLMTPVEHGRIWVEDAPFVAVEMTVAGEGAEQALSFRTNLDQWVAAGPDHPIRVAVHPDSGEPTPYIVASKGLEARIARPVFYDMVARSDARATESGESEVGVWSNGVFFALGTLPEE